MKRPAAFRFAPAKILFAFVGAAALALAPKIALAQHAGGGHAGGGASAGGHASPGGGGGYSAPAAPHFSPPPAPPQTHMAPPPQQPVNAPRFAPPPPRAAAMPHVVQPPAPAVYVPPPAAFIPPRGTPPTSAAIMPPNLPPPARANPAGNNAIMPPAPATPAAPSPGNFPPAAGFIGTSRVVNPGVNPVVNSTATQPSPLFSTTPDAMRARSGQPLRFVGEGHQIYSEPVPATINTTAASSTAAASSTSAAARRPFPGPAGLASATATPGAPPHIFPPHRRVPPVIVNPGFGTIGFGGFGFGTPFFGSPFYFGNPFFFGDPFFGFEFGSVFVPCNGFGAGLQCMSYNSNYYFEQPFTSTMIGGTETQTQTQEIFSPYSPAPPSSEENNNASSPNEYVLYLKNGAVYVVNDYWYEDGKLVYSTSTGEDSVALDQIDLQKTLDVNAKRGLVFTLRPALQPEPPPSATDRNAPPDQGAAPAQPNLPQPDQQPRPDQNAPAPAPQP